MQFDQNNHVVKLCAKGMEYEAEQKPEEAYASFLKAWEGAITDSEKFTAAHYVARHQKTVQDKLAWDVKALEFALKVDDPGMTAMYPSLYLNIAKCHEDLHDPVNAKMNYETAWSFTDHLPDNGYGKMIRSGIMKGLERVTG